MRETVYYNFVSKNHTDKATQTRMSIVRKIEIITGYSLETIIADRNKMEEVLALLRKEKNSGALINALRLYYEAEHGVKYDRYNEPANGAAYVRSLLAGNYGKAGVR